MITSYAEGQHLKVNEPVVSWLFTDADADDVQAAYQAQASADQWKTVHSDSGEVAGLSAAYAMQALPDG